MTDINIPGGPSAEFDAGADSAATASLAKGIARAITQRMGTEPVPQPNVHPKPFQPPTDAAVAAGDQNAAIQKRLQENAVAQTPIPAQATDPNQQAPVQEAVEEVVVELSDIEKALSDAGIDIGMPASEVPQELLPAYERLTSGVVDYVTSAREQQVLARQAVEQVEEFTKRLEESPDKLLLTLAVTKPEIFARAAEVFADMQQNPQVRDIVVRELQAEARLREAERIERTFNQRETMAKAQRVVAETRKAARTYNVPFELAERVVALTVSANGGDLDVTEVDGIVSSIKGGPAQRTIRRVVRVATPQKQQQVAQAPQQSVAGTGVSPAAPKPEPGPQQGSIFRRLIKDASTRIGTGGQ